MSEITDLLTEQGKSWELDATSKDSVIITVFSCSLDYKILKECCKYNNFQGVISSNLALKLKFLK
jgi:hypothetical protein